MAVPSFFGRGGDRRGRDADDTRRYDGKSDSASAVDESGRTAIEDDDSGSEGNAVGQPFE